MHIPYSLRERLKCDTCGVTIANAPHKGDCEYTAGKQFCTLDCKWTFRWRGKFAYLKRITT